MCVITRLKKHKTLSPFLPRHTCRQMMMDGMEKLAPKTVQPYLHYENSWKLAIQLTHIVTSVRYWRTLKWYLNDQDYPHQKSYISSTHILRWMIDSHKHSSYVTVLYIFYYLKYNDQIINVHEITLNYYSVSFRKEMVIKWKCK